MWCATFSNCLPCLDEPQQADLTVHLCEVMKRIDTFVSSPLLLLQNRIVPLDWEEMWSFLRSVEPSASSELWATLDACRLLPLADNTMHRVKERSRIVWLPEGDERGGIIYYTLSKKKPVKLSLLQAPAMCEATTKLIDGRSYIPTFSTTERLRCCLQELRMHGSLCYQCYSG